MSCFLVVCALFAAASADAATVAYYRFEDSPGFTNNSEGTHHLVADAGATQATLQVSGPGANFSDPIPQTSASNDKAAGFNGSSGMDSGTGGGNLITTGEFTIEAFCNADSWGALNAIAAQWDHTSGKRSWILRFASGSMTLFVSQDGLLNESKSPGFTLVTGKDYFIAITFTNGTADFYLRNLTDGGIKYKTETFSSHTSVLATDQITIGEQFGAAFFDGLIDEVRISDTALDPADFLIPVETITQLHYRFEDSPGFTNDSGSSSVTLKFGNGTPTQYTLPGAGQGSAIPDPVPLTGTANDKAADLDPVNERFDSGNSDYFIWVGDFTIEAFFNLELAGAARALIAGSWESGAAARSVMFVEESGTLRLWIDDTGAGDWDIIDSGLSIDLNDDYYAAVTFDESEVSPASGVTFYLQNLTDPGALQTATKAHTTASLYMEDSVVIGSSQDGGNGFLGVIDEVRITSSVLTQEELLITPGGAEGMKVLVR